MLATEYATTTDNSIATDSNTCSCQARIVNKGKSYVLVMDNAVVTNSHEKGLC